MKACTEGTETKGAFAVRILEGISFEAPSVSASSLSTIRTKTNGEERCAEKGRGRPRAQRKGRPAEAWKEKDGVAVTTSERIQSRRFDEMEEPNEDRGDSQHHHQQQYFHVLAVDDSVIDRKLLEKLLTVSSYHVTCVESGRKALEYLGLPDNHDSSTSPPSTTDQQRAVNVNLIITDYCMPGISGYDLLRRVKQSSWKDVPVIVMSSENVPSRINSALAIAIIPPHEKCLEEGAEEFLLKPVQLSDMKRLQPHLSKSLNSTLREKNRSSSSSSTSSYAINNDNSTHNLTNDSNNHHHLLLHSITENSSSGNTASNGNKRKAMSSPTDEIIPDQCIGLAVV
ncbi:hypothetical protein ACLOJK_013880 [Asimina triloba]